jgi:hypothetical protein
MNSGSFTVEAAVVHLADIFCRALNMGSGGDNKIPPLDPLAWKRLKLNAGAIEPIMETMTSEFEDISLSIA